MKTLQTALTWLLFLGFTFLVASLLPACAAKPIAECKQVCLTGKVDYFKDEGMECKCR